MPLNPKKRKVLVIKKQKIRDPDHVEAKDTKQEEKFIEEKHNQKSEFS
jgi:hypothetical protein